MVGIDMDKMKKTLRNEVIIGKAHLLDLEMLVPNRPVRLLAMGDLGTNSSPTSDNPKVEPLSAIHYLVVGAGGDMHQLTESIRKIKENVPRLKVILADSLETPMFPPNQESKPVGVERIIYGSKKMSDASRGLLYHKAGILTGWGGSLACGVAFTLADKIETDATAAFTITNFDLKTVDQLQQ